jgi:hypothetical protein
VPHTRQAKQQLGGVYQQDVMIWLDREGAKARLAGLKALAPAQLEEPARALEVVRLSTEPAAGEPAAAVGPMEGRGALEARLPLAWLGTPPPKLFSLGLETLAPRRPPAPPPVTRTRDGETPASAPHFENIVLWFRATLPQRP